MSLSIFGVGFMISTVSIDQWFYIVFAVLMVGLAITGFMTIYKEVKNERNKRMNEDKAKAIAIIYSLIAFVAICSLVVGLFIGICVTK